jgi:hypothetical protein
MTASLLIRPDGERLRDALAREELAGYRYVLYGWLFALSVVSLYLLATIPLSRTVYYLGIILVFAAVGLAGEGIRRAWPRHARISMGAILLVQISLLTAVLIVPDPLIASQAPPQIAFRTANFLYLYAFCHRHGAELLAGVDAVGGLHRDGGLEHQFLDCLSVAGHGLAWPHQPARPARPYAQ